MRTIADIQNAPTWGRIVDAFLAASSSEFALNGLAARLDMPEQTLRAHIRDGRSPTFDQMIRIMRLAPAPLAHMLLVALAGKRYRVTAVDVDAPLHADPLTAAVNANHQASRLVSIVNEAKRDGRIDADERQRISQGVGELQLAAAGVVPATQTR